jgi:multidrug efflux pump subunit AcrA (membrane-fusion protein)
VLVKTDPKGQIVAEEREVSVGHEQEGKIEITSGIDAGDHIVKANARRLPKGAKVKVAT